MQSQKQSTRSSKARELDPFQAEQPQICPPGGHLMSSSHEWAFWPQAQARARQRENPWEACHEDKQSSVPLLSSDPLLLFCSYWIQCNWKTFWVCEALSQEQLTHQWGAVMTHQGLQMLQPRNRGNIKIQISVWGAEFWNRVNMLWS